MRGVSLSYSPFYSGCEDVLRSFTAKSGLYEALANKHLLLTGATGFFGSWLLACLDVLNCDGVEIEVTALSRNPERFLASQPRYSDRPWINWLVGDVRELERVPGRQVDLIIHAAAETAHTYYVSPSEAFFSIVQGARRVYDFAATNGVERVLVTGSGAQYGRVLGWEHIQEDYHGACFSNVAGSCYGEAKRVQELLGAMYMQQSCVSVVMARCFAFSGPGLPLDSHFALGNFVRDALHADKVSIQSTGQAVRSYLHGADLAVWLLFLLVRGEAGTAYNVGSDQGITIEALARKVVALLSPGKKVEIFGAGMDAERSFYVPDISRAKALGLRVWTSLEESVISMGGVNNDGEI